MKNSKRWKLNGNRKLLEISKRNVLLQTNYWYENTTDTSKSKTAIIQTEL